MDLNELFAMDEKQYENWMAEKAKDAKIKRITYDKKTGDMKAYMAVNLSELQ